MPRISVITQTNPKWRHNWGGGKQEDDTGSKTCWVTELANEYGNFKTKIENLAVRHRGVG